MKLLAYIIAFIVNFIFVLNLNAQHTDPYNLSFDGEVYTPIGFSDNWQFLKSSYFQINRDTLCKFYGKSSLSFSLTERTDFNKGCGFFYQKLPIASTTKELELSCWSRGVQMNNTYLHCHVTNAQNQMISIDSVKLPQSIHWEKSKLKLSLPASTDKRILYISFNSYDHSEGWVDNLDIRLDGIPYYQKMNYLSSSQTKSKSFIEKSDSLSFKNLDLRSLHTPAVIGIGESSHGSHEQMLLRNKLIEYLVLNENAKLIILECNQTFASNLNKYIHHEKIDADINIKDYFESGKDIEYGKHVVNQETIDLIKFLRQYNDKNIDKVNVAGMDLPLISGVKDSIRMHSYDYDKDRDKSMAIQALKHIKTYGKQGEKTIIWGHLGHIMHEPGDITYYNTYNTGKWLSNQLGNNYFIIGLFTSKGSILVNPYCPTELTLATPIRYSLEESCMLTNHNTLFFNTATQTKLDSITSFRFTGVGIERRQFHPFVNVKKLFDAVAYTKESRPCDFTFLRSKPVAADTLIYYQEHPKREDNQPSNIKMIYTPLSKTKLKDGVYLDDDESSNNDTISLQNRPCIDIKNILLFDFMVSDCQYQMCMYLDNKAKRQYNDIQIYTKMGIVIGGKFFFHGIKTDVTSNFLPSGIMLGNLSLDEIQLIEKKYPKKTYWRNKRR